MPFEEWISGSQIKIKIMLQGAEGGAITGWYIYDLNESKIVDSQFDS